MNRFTQMINSAPEGHATLAQRFNVRGFGTGRGLAVGPVVETLGYSQASFQDEVQNTSGVEQECPRSVKEAAFKLLALTAPIFLSGCRGAPSINLVGSFFPAWMLCIGIGVIGVLLSRRVFVRTGIEPHLGALPVVYFCLWVLLTLCSWLFFFRS